MEKCSGDWGCCSLQLHINALKNNRCAAKLKMDDAKGAAEDAKRIIRLRPKWPRGYYLLSLAARNPAAALKAATMAHRLDPTCELYRHTRLAMIKVLEEKGAVVDKEHAAFGAAVRRTDRQDLVPVTVLSGFLGAGKTTLMERIFARQIARVAHRSHSQ